MKQTLLFAALGVVAVGASAQEVGRVLSSVPVIQQVQVPRQVCSQVPVAPAPTSGGGGLLGGLVGAGVGSTIGHGSGQAAAVVAGTLIGAVVGNNVEASNNQAAAAYQSMPQCTTQMTLENRITAYNVTYEYGGREFTAQMPYDPGPTVQLQVSPMAQQQQQGPVGQGGGVVIAPPVQGVQGVQSGAVVQSGMEVVPAPVPVTYPPPYAAYPAYPAYPYGYGYGYPYYRPYFPLGVSLGFVFGGHGHGGHRGGGHRHR
jgi:uncharacterized protein YcfJ